MTASIDSIFDSLGLKSLYAARRCGDRFYTTGKPCPKGHVSKYRVRDQSCARCASDSRNQAKRRCRAERRISPHKAQHQISPTRYFTGVPCANGHIAERRLQSGQCVVCRQNQDKRSRETPEVLKTRRKAERKRQQELAKRQAARQARGDAARQRRADRFNNPLNFRVWVNALFKAGAIERGEDRFFTGYPCNHGHISYRRVSNSACITCSQEKCLVNYKLELQRIAADPMYHYERKAKQRGYYAQAVKHCPIRKPKTLYRGALRRAQKRGAEIERDLDALLDFYAKCPVGWHVDHKNPLSRGGGHVLSNLQYLDSFDNFAKGSKTQEEWEAFKEQFGPGGWDEIRAAAYATQHPWTVGHITKPPRVRVKRPARVCQRSSIDELQAIRDALTQGDPILVVANRFGLSYAKTYYHACKALGSRPGGYESRAEK